MKELFRQMIVCSCLGCFEGYTYQQGRGFDVAEQLAQNEGAGNFSSAGMGLGMMAGVGGAVGTTVGGIFSDAFSGIQANSVIGTGNQFCEECGAKLIPGMAFCDECGHPVPKANSCMDTAKNLKSAYSLACNMEFCAELQYRAMAIGTPVILDDEEMDRVMEKFKSYGQVKPAMKKAI